MSKPKNRKTFVQKAKKQIRMLGEIAESKTKLDYELLHLILDTQEILLRVALNISIMNKLRDKT